MILHAKTITLRWAMVILSAVCAPGKTAAAQYKTAQHKTAQDKTAQCRATPKPAPRTPSRVVETANFRIYGMGGLNDASRLADDLESLRNGLGETWLNRKQLPAWTPKCELVVHAIAGSYVRAVGQDQFATVGASSVELAGRRVSRRRIDIRADQAGWFAAALPHELTHLIMADEFLGRELPNWADEGMAVLADSPIKRSLHMRDLQTGLVSGTDFRLADLVGRSCYPAAARIPVFYGQSVSLVKFLVDRKSPAEFVCFLHRTEVVGYDAAIAEIYGFRGVGELERHWREAVANSSQPNEMLASANAAPGVGQPALGF